MAQNEVDVLSVKKICHRCLGEAFLSAEVTQKGQKRKCSYCDRMGKCFLIGHLAERIETAFQGHYTRTSDEPNAWEYAMQADRELDYEWDRNGQRVTYAIMDAAEIPESAARDVQAILSDKYWDYDAATMGEETEFADGSFYEARSPSDAAWQEEWSDFERALKTQTRFFSRSGAAHLASVFDGIDSLASRDGRPLAVTVGPGSTVDALFRARALQSEDQLKDALARPDQNLGSPPASVARAGRMNAHGISVFYGATSAEVALAEVRPPVGSRVAIAKFHIIRSLRLLDLTALSTVSTEGSIFDPSFIGRLERVTFLRSLSQRITRPVMPDDEAFEYLPTQAIADFLASDRGFDGIVYPSVQAGEGVNVVLFHQAARVAEIDLPKGSTINVTLGLEYEEGWEDEYRVGEEIPRAEDQKAGDRSSFNGVMFHDEPSSLDPRIATLAVAPNSVVVHRILRTSFETDPVRVYRYRWEKREEEEVLHFDP